MGKVVGFLLVGCLTLALHAADKMPKDFKGGGQEPVKSWKERGFEQVKGVAGTYAVYIYDDGRKNNAEAFHLEGKDVLGSKDVQEALAKFTKIRIKEDAKGWPEQWTKDAKNGASLILVSSDMQSVAFDKHKTNAEITGPAIIAAANTLKAHEEETQKAAKAKEKNKEREAADRAKLAQAREKEKGKDNPPEPTDLGIAALDKKTDTKPPAAKDKADHKAKADKNDPKKVADAKPADSKDPKKKAPEDE